MDRRDVQEGWVSRRVRMIPLDEREVSGYDLHGWLRGIEEGESSLPSNSIQRFAEEANARKRQVLALGADRVSGTFARD
jgi:hypothetical protein